MRPTGHMAPHTQAFQEPDYWKWYNSAMQSTIDSAGRLVIPKAIRDRLGLTGGELVDIRERDGTIEVEPAPTPMKIVQGKGGPVAVPDGELPALTDETVRTTIERTRR